MRAQLPKFKSYRALSSFRACRASYIRTQRLEKSIGEALASEEAGREGRWTKSGVIVAVLSLILTYTGLAISNHWPPFDKCSTNCGGSSDNGGSNDGGGSDVKSDGPQPGKALLTGTDLEQATGGSWQSLAAESQSVTCFQLPAGPSKSAAVKLEESLGAILYEVVDSFPTTSKASQAYTSFSSSANNCSWQNTSNLGLTTQFQVVSDSTAPTLDSASNLWDVQGAPIGSISNVAPSHDGAICAVQSGNLDAFAYVKVDTSNSPTLTVLENNIEPALAHKL
jgi:hypothetical protein